MAAPALKILVADDQAVNIAIVRAVASRLGHSVVTASDGREAVRRYREEAPDLVFMDVMMPEMDGLAAVREIRSLPAERWVPVVFLSAMDRMDDIIAGLECGGDDYLVKPVNVRLLQAKINAYARASALQRELFVYAVELDRRQAAQQEENELARHVMARLAQGEPDPLVQSHRRPANGFDGDLILTARTPADVLYVLLADACGHGLAAALTAMQLPPIFYGMTAKGFALPAIASELNRKLKALLPADRFVAATLAAIDVRRQTLEIWNGGNPPALYVGADGRALRFPSRHMALGVLPPESFSDATEITRVTGGGHLLLCSDGLIELASAAAQRLSLEHIEELLTQSPVSARFHRLQDNIQSMLDAGGCAWDDLSFALVHVPTERRRKVRVEAHTRATVTPESDWRFTLDLGPAEMRSLDVVPMLMGMLTQMEAVKPHAGALFLILSELYNNALDHGLLGLDSALKAAEGGFERYLTERVSRLEALAAGRIELGLRLSMEDGQAVLDIRVRDSGPGFDYADYLTRHADADQRPHGRGIALVRGLCRELVYSGCGNEARARYQVTEVRGR